MPHIEFSDHSKVQIAERGTTEAEVIETIRHGETLPAKHGRIAFRRNFTFNRKWAGKFYRIKQVMPIVKHENGTNIVITVYTFYF